VEQYSRVLYPPPEAIDKLNSFKGPEGRSNLLSDARERGEWERFQRERESKRAKERDEEAIAFAEIDWHDFAIVQTIEFTQVDAQSELPLPMTIAEVENMTLTQKRMAAMITENTAPEVEAHKASQAAADAAAAAAKAEEVASRPADNTEMDVASDEEDDQQDVQKEEEDQARARELQARSTEHGAPMKIRKDYVPKSARFALRTLGILVI
jgi:splicing factor 3A subunit 1